MFFQHLGQIVGLPDAGLTGQRAMKRNGNSLRRAEHLQIVSMGLGGVRFHNLVDHSEQFGLFGLWRQGLGRMAAAGRLQMRNNPCYCGQGLMELIFAGGSLLMGLFQTQFRRHFQMEFQRLLTLLFY